MVATVGARNACFRSCLDGASVAQSTNAPPSALKLFNADRHSQRPPLSFFAVSVANLSVSQYRHSCGRGAQDHIRTELRNSYCIKNACQIMTGKQTKRANRRYDLQPVMPRRLEGEFNLCFAPCGLSGLCESRLLPRSRVRIFFGSRLTTICKRAVQLRSLLFSPRDTIQRPYKGRQLRCAKPYTIPSYLHRSAVTAKPTCASYTTPRVGPPPLQNSLPCPRSRDLTLTARRRLALHQAMSTPPT